MSLNKKYPKRIIESAISFLFIFLAIETSHLKAQEEPAQPSRLTGNIQIEGRQLIINGKPFIMKGICYDPVPKGQDQSGCLLVKQDLTQNDLALIRKDFQMMTDAGINTIRTYVPIVNPDILDLINQFHLHTIVPICDNTSALTNVSNIVALLKDEPSTLLWEIGNEWNYNRFYTADSQNILSYQECADLINNVISQIRAADTTHPISTNIGDITNNGGDGLWDCLASLNFDLYGTNLYPGGLYPQLNNPFESRFRDWALLSSKPLYIGEFGANAFPKDQEDLNQQSSVMNALLSQVFENLSAFQESNVLVGGCVFEWTDEWWKDANAPSPNCHFNDNGLLLNDNTGEAGFINEEWWGVCNINREERPVYEVVKSFYKKGT